MSDDHNSETPSLQSAADRRMELSNVTTENFAKGIPSITDIIEFSKLMAQSEFMVPPAFRQNPGACAGIVTLASRLQMDPFAVASKAYVTKDRGGNERIAYEAQFFTALINERAPIKGRIKYEYDGEDQDRYCTAYCETHEGERLEYKSTPIKRIAVKNSPLWKSDPDQQLAYYTGRGLARRHFPDILMGMYTPEEIQQMNYGPDQARDITPHQTVAEKLEAGKQVEATDIEPEAATVDPERDREHQEGYTEGVIEIINQCETVEKVEQYLEDNKDTLAKLPEDLQKEISEASGSKYTELTAP